MCPASAATRRHPRYRPTAKLGLDSLVHVVLERIERVRARGRRPSAVLVDPEVLPERDRALVVAPELDHEQVHARAPVIVTHLHPAHRHRRGAGREDEVGVRLPGRGRERGVVLVHQLRAAQLEAPLGGQRGVVDVEERDVEDVRRGDVGVLWEQVQVAGECRVQERRVVEGHPRHEVRPGVGVARVARRDFAVEVVEHALGLVALLPMRDLALLRLGAKCDALKER